MLLGENLGLRRTDSVLEAQTDIHQLFLRRAD
jgi:hypothetical protein